MGCGPRPTHCTAARVGLCWLRLAQPAYLCRSWRAFRDVERRRLRGDGCRSRGSRSGGPVPLEITGRGVRKKLDGSTNCRVRASRREARPARAANEADEGALGVPRLLERTAAPLRSVISSPFRRLSNRLRSLDVSSPNPGFKIGTDMPLPLSGSSRYPSGYRHAVVVNVQLPEDLVARVSRGHLRRRRDSGGQSHLRG